MEGVAVGLIDKRLVLHFCIPIVNAEICQSWHDENLY
jgi:hypothetical protein